MPQGAPHVQPPVPWLALTYGREPSPTGSGGTVNWIERKDALGERRRPSGAGPRTAPEDVTQRLQSAPDAKKARKSSKRGAAAKAGRHTGEKRAKGARKTSLLDAAVQVLQDAGHPMNTREIVEHVREKGIWTTQGKTPAATLYAAILREIQKKGGQARFEKTERGNFALRQ